MSTAQQLTTEQTPGAGTWGLRLTGCACDFAGLLLVVMAVLIGLEILMRGVIGTSTLVADEFSGYLFVWITMIGFVHALQTGAFLRVDNFVVRMRPRGQAMADLLSAITGLVVSLACTYGTGTLMLASMRFGTVSIQPSATPLWWPQLILPIGFVVLAFLYLTLIVAALKRMRNSTG